MHLLGMGEWLNQASGRSGEAVPSGFSPAAPWLTDLPPTLVVISYEGFAVRIFHACMTIFRFQPTTP